MGEGGWGCCGMGAGLKGWYSFWGSPLKLFFMAKWHLKSILRFKDSNAFSMPKNDIK